MCVCPVAESSLHNYTTEQGPNNCTSGAWAGFQPQVLPSPSPCVYVTAQCKCTFSYQQPETQFIGTRFVDRGQMKFMCSMLEHFYSGQILFFFSVCTLSKNSKNVRNISAVRAAAINTSLTEFQLGASGVADIADLVFSRSWCANAVWIFKVPDRLISLLSVTSSWRLNHLKQAEYYVSSWHVNLSDLTSAVWS